MDKNKPLKIKVGKNKLTKKIRNWVGNGKEYTLTLFGRELTITMKTSELD